jgi:hypothetical protein
MKGPVDGEQADDGESNNGKPDYDDVGDGDETEDEATGLTKSQETEVMRVVEEARAEFWAGVAKRIRGKLAAKELTADEVKRVYEHIVAEEA